MSRINEPWGRRTPYAAANIWPVRQDSQLAEGVAEKDVDQWVRSACVLCSNGCGLEIAVKDGQIVGVRGRTEDRVNHGRLGPKGLFGWQANASPDRLTTPLLRTANGHLEPSDWSTAMRTAGDRIRQVLASTGPLGIGFYTSGQLFLEEYYALTVLARGGIGTPHLDGNTRLCTSTAAFALVESFGMDGQPGSYADFDSCDTIFMVGHNMAETQTVLWSRVLDRLGGPDRPHLIVIDPRRTATAEQATVHLAIRNGTNVAILNALLHEVVRQGSVDHAFIDAHTVGFAELEKVVAKYPPEKAAEICGVDAADIRRAAEILGSAERLVSTVLQGVYQSHQATAAAVQVNNLNLMRGMIGRAGCAVFQFNGQPTAQNTRETGANGALPAFRNWQNDHHVSDLARLWGVDPLHIPHWGPPTHAMQIFQLAEMGTIRVLWISGTNPAVSLPELHRIRGILAQERLFVVVQDAFLTETAQLADLVLPTALWGEKTGTFTNVDRTVHLSEQAINPPGDARSDLDIFLDLGRTLDLRTVSGSPLLPWANPEEVFEAWKTCSSGRPCDYTGLTYDLLRERGAIQWPCNAANPQGTERLYTDLHFPTEPDYTQDYGHDLLTGASFEKKDHMAVVEPGKAWIRASEYTPPHEAPTAERPLLLTTGRSLYHFHTRTKTARAPELQAAAPEMWVELSAVDAVHLGIDDGDMVRVESARGAVEARARVTGTRQGVVFAPFHYGYWDVQDGEGSHRRAANELTITEWDPVSKQPLFKVAAVRVTKLTDGGGSPAAAEALGQQLITEPQA